jgi:hypothetical protein
MIRRLFSSASFTSFTSFTSIHLPASISAMASLQRSQMVG